jgi:hypothetical protein
MALTTSASSVSRLPRTCGGLVVSEPSGASHGNLGQFWGVGSRALRCGEVPSSERKRSAPHESRGIRHRPVVIRTTPRACIRHWIKRGLSNAIWHIQTTPWPESASEIYSPRDRRLSAKLVPTFADIGCHMFSVTDPYGRILGFLDRSRYFFLSSSSSVVLARLSAPRSRPTTSQKIW